MWNLLKPKKKFNVSSEVQGYSYIQKLPTEIKESIIEYTTNKYREINDYLENDMKPNNNELNIIISNIDKAFEHSPKLSEDIIVYRGLNMPFIKDTKRNTQLLLGQYKGKYKGFISTSLDKFSSEMFTFSNTKTPRCCIFKIIVPKGKKCLFLKSISDFEAEDEILLPRNSLISIVSFDSDNNLINAILN
jgi:hypothetical protein